MLNIGIETGIQSKLYGSTVDHQRQHATSAYQKNTNINHYHHQTNNYLSTNYGQQPSKQEHQRKRHKSNTKYSSYFTSNQQDSFHINMDKNSGNQPRLDQKPYSVTERTVFHERKQVGREHDDRKESQKEKETTGHYDLIMQKLTKKDQLLQQLQKLSQYKVSDNLRKSYAYQRDKIDIKQSKVEGYSAKVDRKDGKVDRSYDNSKFSNNLLPPNPSTIKRSSDHNLTHKNPQETKQGYKIVTSSPRSMQLNSQFDYKRQKMTRSYLLDSYDTQDSINKSMDIHSNYKNKGQIGSNGVDSKNSQRQNIKEEKHAIDYRQKMEVHNINKKNQYFEKGKVSIHDFVLTKSLGEGKFGLVYQAIHKQTHSLFAIKKISKQTIKSNLMIDQLVQEIKIQSYCQHPNILKLYGFFDDLDNIYLILEYMEGGTLFSMLKQQKTLDQEETSQKLKEVSQAVGYLHQNGIAHRDIKPQNIVLSNKVGKLCDFGWAAICTERRKTYCGTFDYVAPQILEGHQYDASVDMWCLGVLAYELLVGKAPFYHISRKQTMKKIMKVQKIDFPVNLSRSAVSFIEDLIKKNPEERLNGTDILKHPFLAKTTTH